MSNSLIKSDETVTSGLGVGLTVVRLRRGARRAAGLHESIASLAALDGCRFLDPVTAIGAVPFGGDNISSLMIN